MLPPMPPPLSPCTDENKPNDPKYCQNEVGTIKDKITKCKQTDFIEICRLTCGFCPISPTETSPLPPSPPPSAPPSPKPPCATPIDFVLVLDESYSINRDNGPNYMDGPNGVKALAKELVRHAAMEPR